MQPYRVCVADDCVDEVAVLCEGLKLHSYEAVPAYTGQEALERCAQGSIDLLLLDIGLPDIDGHEVCRRLKENPKTSDIPIVFVTARGAANDVSEGYRLGAVDYIAKPYNLPIVMVRVEAAMRTRQVMDYLQSRPDPLGDTIYTDHLTGLRNRRYLLERLQEEAEKAHRHKHYLSCIVLDVDDIVALDEELGAVSMDDLLVEVALAVRNASRNSDILARYEDSRFAVVLPHVELENAIKYAEKIDEEISSTIFSDPRCPTRARVSFGIVSCSNGHAIGADQILAEAARNLFCATTHRGSRICARDLNRDN